MRSWGVQGLRWWAELNMHFDWFFLMIYWGTDVQMMSPLTAFLIFLYHIQPTAIDHRRDQNVVRIIASMTHGSVLCATFFSFNLAHFYVICDIYYRTVALQNRIQFLKWIPTFYFLERNLLEWNKFGSNDYWKYMEIIYVCCGEEMRYKRSSQLWTLLN